jgi:hypothetical protein
MDSVFSDAIIVLFLYLIGDHPKWMEGFSDAKEEIRNGLLHQRDQKSG